MTGDEERLHGAFAGLLDPAPPHVDPIAGIHQRVGRMQRRRTVVATVAASVTIVGAAAAIYGITRPAGANNTQTATQVVNIDPRLSLRVDAPTAVAVGAEEQVTVTLAGTGEPAETYGLRVAWGDGGIDRVFGSTNCHTGTTGPLDATRTFGHNYLQPGPERIIVEITRCGEVQARSIIPRITVTPGP